MDYKKSKAPVTTLTRDVNTLEEETDNIYETVMILAKRANVRRAFARRAKGNLPKGVQCPCCGEMTLEMAGNYEICPRCGWEDDPTQSADPTLEGGANALSLNQAREKWRASAR